MKQRLMSKMIEIKPGEECSLRLFEEEGFRRNRLVAEAENGDLGTFSHSRGNEIYVLKELKDGRVIPLRYFNLKTGEVRP